MIIKVDDDITHIQPSVQLSRDEPDVCVSGYSLNTLLTPAVHH